MKANPGPDPTTLATSGSFCTCAMYPKVIKITKPDKKDVPLLMQEKIILSLKQ